MKTGVLSLFYLICTMLTYSQDESGDYRVAILVYEGVEVLDFAGPGEVFAATNGFEVFTLTADETKKEILSQGFVRVRPEYNLKDCPQPDIVVLPGGSTGNALKNEDLLPWIKKQSEAGALLLSVCTGARILGEAELLDGLMVTTWHGQIDNYREIFPEAEFMENTRFVDNGDLITTAGVSAGIDGALHLVSRIKGMGVARNTARYMEYDKWHPEDGLINYRNPVIDQVRKNVEEDADMDELKENIDPDKVYEGELKNLANEFSEDHEYEKSARIYELASGLYPASVSLFDDLSDVYQNLGKYAPPKERAYIQLFLDGKIEKGLETYKKTKDNYPDWMLFRESYIKYVGDQFFNKEEYNNARDIYSLYVDQYPRSVEARLSLAKAQEQTGDISRTVTNYKKALDLDPDNSDARQALDRLERGSR